MPLMHTERLVEKVQVLQPYLVNPSGQADRVPRLGLVNRLLAVHQLATTVWPSYSGPRIGCGLCLCPGLSAPTVPLPIARGN